MQPGDIFTELQYRRDTFFQEAKKEQTVDEQYYEDTFDVGVKAPFRTVRTGKGRLHVDTAVDQITFSNPVATRYPRNLTEKERRLQDDVEQWINAFLETRVCHTEPHPVRETIKNGGIFGECFGQVYLDDDGLPSVQIYDPQIIFPSPSVTLGKLNDVIVAYRRSILDIKSQYPDWKPLKDLPPMGQVEWLEYHAPGQYFCAADTNVLTKDVEISAFPFLPWVHSYAGYGRFSGAGKPETLSAGLLRGMRSQVKASAWVASLLDSIIRLWTFPRVFREGEANDGIEIDLSPGMENKLPANVLATLKIDSGIPPHPALFQYAAQIEANLNQWSPSTLRGEPAPSVESGYGQAVVAGSARLRYGTLLIFGERFWSKMMSLVLRTIAEVIKAPVPMYVTHYEKEKIYKKNVVLTPEMIDGYYDVEVKLEGADPESRQRRMLIGAQLRQQGVIPHRLFLEDFAQYPNATDIMAEIDAENLVRTSPALRALMEQRVVEDMGIQDEVEALQLQQQQEAQMQQGVQQAQMEPQIPGVPPRPPMPGSYDAARQAISRMKRVPMQQGGIPMGPPGTRPEMGGP